MNWDFNFEHCPIVRVGEQVIPQQPCLVLLGGDGSDRLFYRFKGENQPSAICMKFHTWQGGHGGSPQDWLTLHQWLEAHKIPVPYLIKVEQKSACLWLQDLGDTFLCDVLEQRKLLAPTAMRAVDLYQQALLLLLKAQYTDPVQPPPTQLVFDTEKLFYEMEFFATHFLNHLLGFNVSQATEPALWKEWRQLCQWLSDRPRVLTHRDYHCRNLMLHNDTLYWIDFQDARMGPHAYDVVSLLRDCYIDMPWSLRESLMLFYHTHLVAVQQQQQVPVLGLDSFMLETLHTGLQRNMKALGSYGFLALEKKKSEFLLYVPQALDLLLAPQSHTWQNVSIKNQYPKTWDLLSSCKEKVSQKNVLC